MESVKAWCMRIAGVLILSALCEGVLPSGEIKKYVRILMGLILTICICGPLTKGFDYEIIIDEVQSNAYIDSEKMDERERETVLRLYKANLAGKMDENLKSVIGDCEFEFQIEVESGNMEEFGKIKSVIVTVVTDNGELSVSELVEKVISEKYGVAINNIAVNYKSK